LKDADNEIVERSMLKSALLAQRKTQMELDFARATTRRGCISTEQFTARQVPCRE